MIVGDLNVAASQQDVHAKYTWEAMYGPEEKRLMAQLLGSFRDVWRLRHPGVADAFTVWDEKTSARVFNEARSLLSTPHAPCMRHACSSTGPFASGLPRCAGVHSTLLLRMHAGARE
jgi:hypothetical protein